MVVRGLFPERCASKQCGTFIDEVPGCFQAQRKAAASKVREVTGSALDLINARTNKEAVADSCPEAVEAILGACNDRVLKAINDEVSIRIDEIIIHSLVRNAACGTM